MEFVMATLVSIMLAIAGIRANFIPGTETYKFVSNTERWVCVIRNNGQFLGKLDLHGEFTQEKRMPAGSWSVGVPPHVVINGGSPRKAYEFRSGVLIPGEIQDDGRFVPEVGGKIIKFSDYTYTPTASRIWNLPGYFVSIEPKPADKK